MPTDQPTITPAKRKRATEARTRIDAALGWYWPANARKAHAYDADRRSLCGNYGIFGPVPSFEPIAGKTSPDDCAGCRAKLNRLTELAALTGQEPRA